MGLRILEIGHFVAAPFCTRLLADLGADIIKLEPPDGDPVRQWGAHIDGKSVWWSVHGRNKRSVTLNLKTEKGRDLARSLATQCDAVVENFRPGQLAKLGLGDDELRRARPDLIIAHVSGYGQDGPYRDRAAFGVIGEAIGGLRHLTNHGPGTTGLPPVRVGVSIGDSIAGLYAAFGIVAALCRRYRSPGEAGLTLDVALTESVLSMMEGMLPEFGALNIVKQPTGGAIATAAPSNAYPTSDGAWILIAANSDRLFARLVALIDAPELLHSDFAGNRNRVHNATRLDGVISGWTRTMPAVELEQVLNAADIPNSKVFTVADIAQDPQFRERGMVREVADPAFGTVLHPGIVPHVVEAPGEVSWPGCELGAHNAEIFGDMLGLSPEAILQMREEGVIG
ncbi:CoA transferase [Sphingopyxis sp. SE2]|uniref:CaiB/BaiF CoA transferase family protein n=1 Tax=Sphingopyxis sp. SE2 TaxID=1586240 RepID=UPI0028C1AD1D|nr:CoA transferase [Sphingopyxis sp. SE2]MDT7531700.1 CoA transferase [Sphingopyxis sp. SE2]